MGKIKYDVSDVEPGTDFDTPVPRGTYRCKITDCKEGESRAGNDMLTIEYEIATGEWKNRKLWDYIVLDDSSAWKLRQFTDALGKRAKGTLDTDSVMGERVLVRVKHETDDRDPENPVVRARVGSVSAIPDDADEEPEDEEEVEDDGAGDDDGDDDDTAADAEGDEDGDEEELTREDLDEYTRDDLEELIEEEDLEVDRTKKTKLSVLRNRVWDALTEGEEDDDEEGDEDDDDEEEVDYEEMSIADLTAELKARGLNTKTKLKGTRKKKLFIKRLEEDDENGEEPF